MSVTTETKKEIFKKYGGKVTNTGSTQAQIALFSTRIKDITGHLNNNRKDFSSTRSLVRMVGQRRKLLSYLAKRDLEGYRALIKKLDLRR